MPNSINPLSSTPNDLQPTINTQSIPDIPKKNRKRKLTLKQRKFIKYLTKGMNQAEAALAAGYSPASCKSVTSVMLTNPNSPLHASMAHLLDTAGLTDKAIADKVYGLSNAKKTLFFADKGVVTDQRDVEALEIQRSTVELAAKLKGHMVERSLNINLNADVDPIDLERWRNG